MLLQVWRMATIIRHKCEKRTKFVGHHRFMQILEICNTAVLPRHTIKRHVAQSHICDTSYVVVLLFNSTTDSMRPELVDPVIRLLQIVWSRILDQPNLRIISNTGLSSGKQHSSGYSGLRCKALAKYSQEHSTDASNLHLS